MDGEMMLQGHKRKAMESELEDTEDPVQFHRQRVYLLQLTESKFRDTYGYIHCRKRKDYHKRALLRSTLISYKKQRMEEDKAVEMFQNGSPPHKTSRDDTPRSCTPGPAELFMESRKVSSNTSDSTPIICAQPAEQGPPEIPDSGPSSSDFYDILNSMEDLLTSPAKPPEQCLEELAYPGPDDSLFLSSDLIPNFQVETRVCDCFSPEEPLNDTSPGNLETLVANYLGNLSGKDYFDEIDISEFKTTSAP